MSAAPDRKCLRAADWRRCAEAGMTAAQAAEALGRTIRAAWYMSSKRGIQFKGGRVATRARWAACAAAGMTKAEAAKHLGVSRTAATNAAKRYGLRFRGRYDMGLTPKQEAEYRYLTRRCQYRKIEALVAIGRADLVEA